MPSNINMMPIAVFLLSFSALAFEVLLTRFFSISQWNHLAFMVISIALFGFAVSGTFLSVLDRFERGWITHLSSPPAVAVIIVAYSFFALAAFVALNNIPLDYFRLPIETVQLWYLLAAFILLALPFFFSGLMIALAYTVAPQISGFVYFASMAGSAVGAVTPALLLTFLEEERLIVLAALCPLVQIPFCLLRRSKNAGAVPFDHPVSRYALLALCTGMLVCGVWVLGREPAPLIRINPSPYKALAQILKYPNTRIAETFTGIRGRTERIKTPHIRYAPGLSLKYAASLPHQHAIFVDGDNQFVLYDSQTQRESGFATHMLSYAGYYLSPNPESVLLIESSGGSAIPSAIASGARRITLIEANPHLAESIRRHYHLPVVIENPRAFLAKSHQRFNVIQLENWGASIPGAAALNQEHGFTIEAFSSYLDHLTPDGVLIISRKLLWPPSDALRMWAAARVGLMRAGRDNPEQHLAILRSWDTYTLLVSARPITTMEVAIREFARRRNYDLVYLHGMTQESANIFNAFEQPYYYLAIQQLAAAYRTGDPKKFFRDYLLDVAPQSDQRPFPGRFLKWPKLSAYYKSMGNRLYALLLSGEVVVPVIFMEALVVSVFILVLPLILITRGATMPTWPQVVYFFGIGAGFMFVELFFINRFVLLFGDPVISFTVVVSGILIFTALGGLWAQQKDRRDIRSTLLTLIGALLTTAIGFELLSPWILKTSEALRYGIALLFLLPSAFLMGLPFPLAMRDHMRSPIQRAYAWSVNGCASVLASIACAQIAISFGMFYIIACAVCAYLVVLTVTAKR